MKRIILVNLNGQKLSFKLSPLQQSQRRENASSQCKLSPRKKILPWGLIALRESVLNGYCPKGKVLVCVLEKMVRFERGEREIDLLVHAH